MSSSKLNEQNMGLGSCFAIFLVIAIVLLLLFCLLLKWYEYLYRTKKQKAANIYQNTYEIHDQTVDNQQQGAYEQYCQHKENNKKQTRQDLTKEDQFMNNSLKRQITKISNDFYGLSTLRQRLNKDTSYFDPFISHQIIPLKELSFPRVNTLDTYLGSKSWRNFHQYIKKLICYEKFGISLVQVQAQSLRKQGENIILKKQMQQTNVEAQESQFEIFLESLGLQMFEYCYSKVVCQVDISQVKDHATYSIKSLQTQQFKQDISKEQYRQLLHKLKNEQISMQ